MKNKIKINSIELINFKGIKNLKINFNDTTNIFGDNGTGKTTIFDAFMWLFFGKNSEGKTDFNIKPLDKNNNPIQKTDVEVNAEIDFNGEISTAKRVLKENWVKKRGSFDAEFQGNKTEYFWNDVPKKQSEYQSKILQMVDESVFKLITNPTAFNSLHWKERRSVLIELSGINDDDLLNDNEKFSELAKKLVGKDVNEYKSQMSSQRSKTAKELDVIPTRIDEVERNTPEALDWDALKSELESKNAELKEIQDQKLDRGKQYQKATDERTKINSEIFNYKGQLESIENQIKEDVRKSMSNKSEKDLINEHISSLENELTASENALSSSTAKKERLNGEIENVETKIASKRKEWETENAKTLEFDDHIFNCPTCLRKFEDGDIDKKKSELKTQFDKTKDEKLSEITSQGQALANEKQALQNELKDVMEYIDEQNSIIQQIKKRIAVNKEALSKVVEPEKDERTFDELVLELLDKNSDYNKIKSQITILNKSLQDVEKVDVDDLVQSEKGIELEIEAIKNKLAVEQQINKSNQRKDELLRQEKVLTDEMNSYDKELFLIDEFIKFKSSKIEGIVNERFNYVVFKLFDFQINGAMVECCDALINGVPFTDANNAAKVNAGVDIINSLCEYYGINAPIFIDNRESVVNLIETQSQVINLIVSEPDKKLRIN